MPASPPRSPPSSPRRRSSICAARDPRHRLRRAVPVLVDRGRVPADPSARRRSRQPAPRTSSMAYEFKLPGSRRGSAPKARSPAGSCEVGQEIAEDDPLVEIQTDKTTVEMPSPAAGIVAAILVAGGELVPVGTPLVVIGDGDVPAAAARPTASRRTSAPSGRIQATPLVRKIAGRARRRPRHRSRARGRGADHRGRRSRGLRRPAARAARGACRSRNAAAHRRAPDARAPRGPGRHRRRGVRLHGPGGEPGRAFVPRLPDRRPPWRVCGRSRS